MNEEMDFIGVGVLCILTIVIFLAALFSEPAMLFFWIPFGAVIVIFLWHTISVGSNK